VSRTLFLSTLGLVWLSGVAVAQTPLPAIAQAVAEREESRTTSTRQIIEAFVAVCLAKASPASVLDLAAKHGFARQPDGLLPAGLPKSGYDMALSGKFGGHDIYLLVASEEDPIRGKQMVCSLHFRDADMNAVLRSLIEGGDSAAGLKAPDRVSIWSFNESTTPAHLAMLRFEWHSQVSENAWTHVTYIGAPNETPPASRWQTLSYSGPET
jgi:hypothetical protein